MRAPKTGYAVSVLEVGPQTPWREIAKQTAAARLTDPTLPQWMAQAVHRALADAVTVKNGNLLVILNLLAIHDDRDAPINEPEKRPQFINNLLINNELMLILKDVMVVLPTKKPPEQAAEFAHVCRMGAFETTLQSDLL